MSCNPEIKIITPAAAAWVWRCGDAKLRHLALAGKLPFRFVKLPGRARWRAYSVASLIEILGEPDPDRLGLLLRVDLLQVAGGSGAHWILFMPRPSVETEDGNLAVDLESSE